ncbi:AAA family ATPase [Hymenobacter sp. CA1UV-4]|nr:AAA family ATPase [Hymenobacter sp. CA1UV-4]MDO7853343.1 AAA family ATPase [Hymenobacter sp. CA1UV-4]
MDDFFLIFFKEAYNNQVSAIGITDYFSIERYHDAVEYRRQINNKVDSNGIKLFDEAEILFISKIFLFPNVELRMLPSTGKANLINIHCLFNPDYVNELDNDFFSHITNQEGKKMNRHGITSYGRLLDDSISTPEGQYKKGIDNFAVSLSDLKELAKNKQFRDNTLFVVSNSDRDGASGLQESYELFGNDGGSMGGVRKSIYYLSDAIFATSPGAIKYFLGKKSEGKDNYNEALYKLELEQTLDEIGSLKPCIVGCDAHKEQDLFKRFTWVKADLSFEGLRQICFEPEYRVRIQNNAPDFKEEKLLIEKVKFVSPNSVFSTNAIHFNPNLNVIIGGKSSGKSILLYAIAKTLSADSSVLKRGDDSYKYDLNKIEKDFDFEITTKGGFSQRLNRADGENSILPEIKYIPQGYLVRLAEPELNKTGESLNKIVRDLIIEDDSSKEAYQGFLSKVTQGDRLRNAQIDFYFETREEIEALEEELKTKSKSDVLSNNIESNIRKVEELNKGNGLTKEQVEEYKKLQTSLDANGTKFKSYKEDLSAIKAFNYELLQTLKGLASRKTSLLDNLMLDEIKEYYQKEYALIDNLVALSEAVETSLQVEVNEEGKRRFKNDCTFKQVISRLNEEQKRLHVEIEPYQKDEEVRKAVDELNASISNDRKALHDITSITKKIADKKKGLDTAEAEIFKIYENSFKEYLSIIEQLKERTVELEKDGLKIVGKAQFNFVKLRKQLIPVSDGRRASYNQYDILSEAKKATDEVDFKLILDSVKQLFKDITVGIYKITNKISIANAVKLVLDDFFFDYWQISYKNDRLGEMSTGKASFVILMLIVGLSKSKAPILIDQPEDNLDNRSITADLVDYLRNKKLDRQIIIVTHNANVVVNADAENVIVANQKGQSDDNSTSPFKFDYINGAIENSFEKLNTETDVLKSMGIRQHIADIVEGGKEAFVMREKRYRFN